MSLSKPVSFTLAKLLKEKGYVDTTKSAYLFNSEIANVPGGEFSNKGEKYISAPTIAEVVDWLFEKYEIWTYVHKDGGWWFPVIENYYDEDDQGTIIEDLSKMTKTYFDSLTEAYEAAITYTLTNLI